MRAGLALVAMATSLLACTGAAPAGQRAKAAPVTAPAPAPAPGPSTVADRLGELFERGMRGGDQAALAAAFAAMRGLARPDELPFIDRIEALASEIGAAGEDLDAVLRTAIRALEDLEKLAPDIESRLAIGHQTYALANVAAGEPAGREADALALGASERLVRDRPADPRAWSLRAWVLRRIAGDLVAALGAARRCSGEHAPCAALAWQLVREIEAPRCKREDLRPGFALHRGTRQGRSERSPREVVAGAVTFWIADKPAISTDDVEEIVGDEGHLLIALTGAAAPKLEAFRTQDMAADAAGVVFVDGAPIGAAQRQMPMMRGRLLLGAEPGAPLPLEAVCARITRERAPD